MVGNRNGLPSWMPKWLWRLSHSLWFGCVAVGLMAYFLSSLINDITGMLPLWVRLFTWVVATVVSLFGMMWDWKRLGGVKYPWKLMWK